MNTLSLAQRCKRPDSTIFGRGKIYDPNARHEGIRFSLYTPILPPFASEREDIGGRNNSCSNASDARTGMYRRPSAQPPANADLPWSMPPRPTGLHAASVRRERPTLAKGGAVKEGSECCATVSRGPPPRKGNCGEHSNTRHHRTPIRFDWHPI